MRRANADVLSYVGNYQTLERLYQIISELPSSASSSLKQKKRKLKLLPYAKGTKISMMMVSQQFESEGMAKNQVMTMRLEIRSSYAPFPPPIRPQAWLKRVWIVSPFLRSEQDVRCGPTDET